jgi:magnesium-protoporphyrin IX monomethyl ester (oxidative) cyclase
MRFLAVHPGPLMYTEVFLRLEPLGLELVAEAVRRAGHEVQLIDLQTESHAAYFKLIKNWHPDVIAFSCNFLANVPEIVNLAKATKLQLPKCFLFVGGHSASFTSKEFLEHGEGAIDCVLRGEGESSVAQLVQAVEYGWEAITEVPGAVTLEGNGPPPVMVQSLDDIRPARDLVRHRRKYFIGQLDPCASIEFSRGCPWDCNFCSAWTFYGRNYRTISPEVVAEELGRIKESGIFIVDDVAFIQSKHGMAIGEAIARKGIKKKFYLETRGDVLLRNKEVFKFWRDLGVEYMFLGLEAIDEEGLRKFRKRVTLDKNFEALECARALGITVAINIIADPDWDRERFEVVRQWCLEVPEVVNISVNTPYPGTETWHTDSHRLTTRDYRLFDIQHAVLPTRLPLEEFYAELLKTQYVMNRKHISWRTARHLASIVTQRLVKGQFNFLKMLWRFNKVYNLERLLADHAQQPDYKMALPAAPGKAIDRKMLYVHKMEEHRVHVPDKAADAPGQFIEEAR